MATLATARTRMTQLSVHKKKIFVSLVLLPHCAYFFMFHCDCSAYYDQTVGQPAFTTMFTVCNGWMDAGYLEVLVVQSSPAFPDLPHRRSHLGPLVQGANT